MSTSFRMVADVGSASGLFDVTDNLKPGHLSCHGSYCLGVKMWKTLEGMTGKDALPLLHLAVHAINNSDFCEGPTRARTLEVLHHLEEWCEQAPLARFTIYS